MLKIELSLEADRDLNNIEYYTFTNFGLPQTLEYLADINEALQTIQSHPHIGQKIDFEKRNLLCFQIRHHRIFYRPDATVILVLRILHEKQVPSLHMDGSLE